MKDDQSISQIKKETEAMEAWLEKLGLGEKDAPNSPLPSAKELFNQLDKQVGLTYEKEKLIYIDTKRFQNKKQRNQYICQLWIEGLTIREISILREFAYKEKLSKSAIGKIVKAGCKGKREIKAPNSLKRLKDYVRRLNRLN